MILCFFSLSSQGICVCILIRLISFSAAKTTHCVNTAQHGVWWHAWPRGWISRGPACTPAVAHPTKARLRYLIRFNLSKFTRQCIFVERVFKGGTETLGCENIATNVVMARYIVIIVSYLILRYWRRIALYPYRDNFVSNKLIFRTTLKRSSATALSVTKRELLSSLCAVTPTYEQLLDTIRESIVMLDWSLRVILKYAGTHGTEFIGCRRGEGGAGAMRDWCHVQIIRHQCHGPILCRLYCTGIVTARPILLQADSGTRVPV